MEPSAVLESVFRWIHIVAGIAWIGLLYFFNFVNAGFAATMDGPTKQRVVPELMPRALYWFRWGAAWTWVTGVLLLLLVFWHGGVLFAAPGGGSMALAVVMAVVTFLGAALYDALATSALGRNPRTLAAVGLALVAIVLLGYVWAGFGYRAYVIHTGALFGTIMAFNVWMRIWPAQRQIIAAIRQGQSPDAGLVALAGARSRHNTYLSVPLVWTMIDTHTTAFASGGPVALLVMIVIGWAATHMLYLKAGAVKGV